MFYSNEELKVIANVVADKTGVQLREEGKTWKVNAKTKVIYYPEGTIMSDVEIGYIVHESAHLRFSFTDIQFFKDLEALLKPLKKNFDQLYRLFEVVEDVRVDSLIQELYVGAAPFLLANVESDFTMQCDSLAQTQMFNPKEFKDFVNKQKYTQFSYYLMNYAYLGEFFADMWLPYMHKDAIEASKKAIEFIPLMEKAKNGDDVFNVMDKLLPLYVPLCDDIDEKKEKEEQEQKKKKAEQKKKEFDEMMKQIMEALKKMFKDAQKRKAEGSAGDGKRAEKKKGEGKEGEGKGGGMGAGEGKEEERELEIAVPGGKGLKQEEREKIFGTSYTDFDLDALNEELAVNLPKVRKAMSVLKDLDTERLEGNYESGKLQNRRLYKLMAGKTKVFTRKVADINTDKNMAVAVVVDESGSMSRLGSYEPIVDGNRFTHKCHYACISTALIAKALEMTHKPYAVYGFNGKFETHKDWDKKLELKEMLKVVANAEGANHGASYNNDGYAIWRVAKELAKRPERNKVMIVLSDGLPAPSGGSSPEEDKCYSDYDLKTEAQKAEKVAKVYGIGIADDGVTRYYKRHKVIEDVSQLAVALTKIFNENTGKRIR